MVSRVLRKKRLWSGVGLTAVASLLATGAFASSGGTSVRTPSLEIASTASRCSKATALRLVNQHRLDVFLSPHPVPQLLCGSFTGPGSEAMAVTIGAPTCWTTQRWAVFRFTEGEWQLVLDRIAFIFPLAAVGADIRETTPVFRPGDPRCIPSGGSHARIWHWNGKRLVAGPWKQVKAGSPSVPVMTDGHFKTPSGNIVCYHSPGPKDLPQAFLACGIKSGLKPAPPRRTCSEGGYAGDRVELLATGRVSVPSCAGDPGALAGESAARVLGYGKTWSGGGIRCTSALTGLTCRNKSGHGFFLSRESWRRF